MKSKKCSPQLFRPYSSWNYYVRGWEHVQGTGFGAFTDKMVGNAEAYLACPKSVKPGTKHKKGPFHRIGAGF